MYCYDEQGNLLGVVSCFPEVGEQHMWGDDVYECIGRDNKRDCTSGMVFRHIEHVVYGPQATESNESPSDSGSRPSELEAFGNDCKSGNCEV